MAKSTTVFVCQECGESVSKWMGRCTSCNSWDSFVEVRETKTTSASRSRATSVNVPVPIVDVREDQVSRISTNDEEFDLVLGGGLVEGSMVLIGGAPGVGKSTLLLKIAGNLAKVNQRVLYVSGEESSGQIKLRANRLDANHKNIHLLSEIILENIMKSVNDAKEPYDTLIVDSIQTLYSDALTSSPGSISQVREITFHLMRMAKEKQIAIFIIGHITKEGSIAGPRVLEHMVDTVLYFDNNASRDIRILRAFKNRFGSTNEIAIFEMQAGGLVSVKNLSTKFLDTSVSENGSALTIILEGSRGIVVEVQALVSDASYGAPKRSSNGFDSNRLTMLLALLEKKLGFEFNQYDVFINVTGGIKISEPSADLAVVAAVISSLKNRPISKQTVLLGEVSLTGDIREVGGVESRVKEVSSQGFGKVVLRKKVDVKGVKYFEVSKVEQILDWM